ncbi:FAD-dependent oxidoreductase [Legionella shakespearei]|uniref:Flavin containing amine oxidoreductase n=1 Tax=Legionella shakespearei DSM 23087 TaxID=1122169 RepID=A0A0W0YYQ7_9GAMM|nr:FAD-dependent oxidoreductase [Legionella shakespearei]KTD61970.1 flavin containing amine oxidoreductase [Legionella shakespearei DSM 23087]
MKEIIIIGGGGAGMGALWALSKTHDVTLLEAGAEIGGHAYTHEVQVNDKKIAIDMGVEYIHERLSPNFFALINQLQLPSYIAPLSFCAFSSEDREHNYWSNSRLGGTLNERFFDEMNRFHNDLQSLVFKNKDALKRLSVGDFVKQRNYSDDFAKQVLLPILTTFSGCRAPSLDYSLLYVALSFNMNLLSFFSPCHWRKLSGGIHQYLLKLSAQLQDKIRLNCKVKHVAPQADKVIITLDNNETMEAKRVVFACQAEIALKLIKNPDALQQKILAAFEYVDVQSSLHTDKSALNLPQQANEYFQFELADTPSYDFPGYLTRVINHLQPYYQLEQELFVSFDRAETLDSDKIIVTKNWRLPKLRPKDLWNKMQVHTIQGKNNLWYCGTDYSLTGHEGAMVSGLVIAHHLGAAYPFEENWLAKAQFNTIKQFMGIYSKTEKIKTGVNQKAFSLAKKLKINQKFAHHVMSELLF